MGSCVKLNKHHSFLRVLKHKKKTRCCLVPADACLTGGSDLGAGQYPLQAFCCHVIFSLYFDLAVLTAPWALTFSVNLSLSVTKQSQRHMRGTHKSQGLSLLPLPPFVQATS